MNNLEEYFKINREAFDVEELPEGHLERFMGRVDRSFAVAQDDRRAAHVILDAGKARDERRGAKRISWATVTGWAATLAAVAAAVAAVVIFIGQPETGHTDWFAGIGDDQAAICESYYARVSRLYELILRGDPEGSCARDLESIAEESVSMIDQLPEELSPEIRAEILKEYYSALLDGVERLRKSVY
ncbi:MAG: hypothetical protein IJ840_08880 [Bacteroidales bacterium]|nr:hypothetical protein [Bacteroidales bacterium]